LRGRELFHRVIRLPEHYGKFRSGVRRDFRKNQWKKAVVKRRELRSLEFARPATEVGRGAGAPEKTTGKKLALVHPGKPEIFLL
jgi:hypothetical protein